jgi:hypothetical protein
LYQLIYMSGATRELKEMELARLLLATRSANAARDVSGILLYDAGSFLQVLEGECEVVEKLYERIKKDPRHARVRTLLQRTVEKRQFNDWSMGFVDIRQIAGGLPGYSDFLAAHRLATPADTLVMNVLSNFSEGQFRNYVKTA